jgi:hypothetical protein
VQAGSLECGIVWRRGSLPTDMCEMKANSRGTIRCSWRLVRILSEGTGLIPRKGFREFLGFYSRVTAFSGT